MGRQAAIGAVLVTLGVPAAVAHAATEPSLLRVISPAPEGVQVDGNTVRALAGVRPGARVIAVRLDGRPVRFAETRRGGAVSIVVRVRGGLRPGKHTLSVTSRRDGRTDFDAVSFIRARIDRSLLSVLRPTTGRVAASPVRVVLRVPRRATDLRVWVNGRRLPASQWELPWRGGRVGMDLTASDGLRHGGNTVRVLARNGHRVHVATRRFVVARTSPLAGPGSHRRVHAGRHVVLDASSSRLAPVSDRTAGAAASASYAWRLTSAPEGSGASLTGANGPSPTLTTDAPGTYTAELVVTDAFGRASASAAVNVFAVDPGPRQLRTTPHGGPGGLGITVGDTTYPTDPSVDGPVVHVIALSRATGSLIPGFDVTVPRERSALQDLDSRVSALGSDALVVAAVAPIGTIRPGAADGALTRLLKTLGATRDPDDPIAADLAARAARTGVGIARVPGSPSYLGRSGGALRGYLVPTVDGGMLGIAFGDYLAFGLFSDEAPTNGNTITLGDRRYRGELSPSATWGVQVVALDPVDLTTHIDTVFDDARPGGLSDQSNAVSSLTSVLADPLLRSKLVFIATIGRARPIVLDDLVLERLGGSSEALSLMSEGGRYGLVRAPGVAVEDGSVIRSDPSQARSTPGDAILVGGLISRGGDGAYTLQPMAGSDPSAAQIAQIAYAEPTPWPYSQTPGDLAAARHIARGLGLGADSPRDAYTDDGIDFGAKETLLTTLRYPGEGHGFSADEFTALVTVLTAEFSAVQDVRRTLGAVRDTFGSTGLQQYVDIGQIATQVEDAVRPPPTRQARFDIRWMFTRALNAAAGTPFGRLGAFKFSASLMSMAWEFSTPPGQTPDEAPEVVARNAAALGAEVPARINRLAAGIGVLEDAILSDAGRLAAAEAKVGSGEWAWSEEIAAAVRSHMITGARAESWAAVMRPVYVTYALDATRARSAASNGGMYCSQLGQRPREGRVGIYASANGPATLARPVATASSRSPRASVIARRRASAYINEWAKPPGVPDLAPRSLLDQIFRSTADPAPGLGVYPPQFFARLDQYVISCPDPASTQFRPDPEHRDADIGTFGIISPRNP